MISKNEKVEDGGMFAMNDSQGALDEEACIWVERFAVGRGSRADIAALKQWMAQSPAHAEAFERVSRTWSSLDVVGDKLAAKGLLSLNAHPARSERMDRAGHMGRRVFLGGALAASAAGVAALAVRPPFDLWPSLSELAADFRTRPGEQRQFALNGHVSIDMNTRTSLVRTAGVEARIVAGEVMISSQASSEATFTLAAADGRIIAARGRVNVRVDRGVVCTTCIAGLARVEQGPSTVSLNPGEQVTYTPEGMGTPIAVDVDLVTAWQDGNIIFDAAPVSDVIAEVNRYRSEKIFLTNNALGRRLFSARLRIESIGYVVRQIELAFGARATELPGGIILLG